MAEQQEREIGEAIARVFSEDNRGGLCCTLETVNSEGQEVAVQIMHDAINIALYPFEEDPSSRLQESGILEQFAGPGVEVLARHRGRGVFVRQQNVMGTSFHPELTADRRVHEYFVRELVRRGSARSAA